MNMAGFKQMSMATGLRILCLAGFSMLAGCAVNPNTGRNQLIALSAAQIAYSDMGFSLAAAAAGVGYSPQCANTMHQEPGLGELPRACANEENVSRFIRQVERIGAELASEARNFAPDLFTRIRDFQITVEAGGNTSSSAGGRIVLSRDLAALDPTDDVVAFLIAREMGHVIARHGEEVSGARMMFSALSAVFPIGGLVLKFAASLVGSQALTMSWAERQRRDADEIALTLLDRSGRSPGAIARNLRIGLRHDRLADGEWGTYLGESIERATVFAQTWPEGPQLANAK
jgi:Zn-dependent protease with chaperone function